MSELTEKIRDSILAAIDADRIMLPTLPEVALNVRQVARDPNTTVSALCQVLEKDAAIAARVIKIANSPMFRGNKTIDNLKTATTRLGVRYTANYATGIAMKQMFQATTNLVDEILRETWNTSTTVATFAHAFAQLRPGLHPDQASLAGLTHRIGVLPVLTYAEDNRKLLSNLGSLKAIIEVVHQDIGARILQAWDFPRELVEVPLHYLDFDREVPSADYIDLVTAAVLQDSENPEHPYHSVNRLEVKALQRLGLTQAADSEEEQNRMIEHIELAAVAFAE